MRELFDGFIEYAFLHRAPSTAARYESQIRIRLEPRFGDMPFPVSRSAIQAYIDQAIKEDWPTTSIARDRTVLQAAFRWAVRNKQWLTYNPAHDLDAPRAQAHVRASQRHGARQPAVDIPSTEEVMTFLEVNRDDPLSALYYAGFMLGMRPSELVAMSEDQITPGPSGRAEYVLVHKALERTKPAPGHIVVVPPKWASYRDLHLAPGHDIFNVLLDQAESMRQFRSDNPTWPAQWDGFLFRRTTLGANGRGKPGEPYAPDQIPALFKKAAARAGWPDTRTPHHMRHYNLSAMIQFGFSIAEVAEWSGHRTRRILEETYIHVLRQQARGGRIADALTALNLPIFKRSGVTNGVRVESGS